MGEFELIQKYFSRAVNDARVSQAGGDDCALISVPEGYELAFSIDTLLPDRHFFSDDKPEHIAQRAMRVAISDLAAAGATPFCFTLSLSIPEVNEPWLQAFSDSLYREAEFFSCPLVGGDTVRGPLSISLQVQGLVPKGKMLLRSGAQVDDIVYVSGSVGDAAAALHVLTENMQLNQHDQVWFEDAYYRPQAQIQLGEKLRDVATSAIDISDGLAADLGHICSKSGIGAELDLAAIPISKTMRKNFDVEKTMEWALSGGDDYQLCFTAPKKCQQEISKISVELGLEITPIGKIVSEHGLRSVRKGSGASEPIHSSGFVHFG